MCGGGRGGGGSGRGSSPRGGLAEVLVGTVFEIYFS